MRRIVQSVGVSRFAYYPICGGAECISYWVFITPFCGIGLCSTEVGGCCTYCCGPAGGQAVLGDAIHFWILSSV
jgi:hypothetical protein